MLSKHIELRADILEGSLCRRSGPGHREQCILRDLQEYSPAVNLKMSLNPADDFLASRRIFEAKAPLPVMRQRPAPILRGRHGQELSSFVKVAVGPRSLTATASSYYCPSGCFGRVIVIYCRNSKSCQKGSWCRDRRVGQFSFQNTAPATGRTAFVLNTSRRYSSVVIIDALLKA